MEIIGVKHTTFSLVEFQQPKTLNLWTWFDPIDPVDLELSLQSQFQAKVAPPKNESPTQRCWGYLIRALSHHLMLCCWHDRGPVSCFQKCLQKRCSCQIRLPPGVNSLAREVSLGNSWGLDAFIEWESGGAPWRFLGAANDCLNGRVPGQKSCCLCQTVLYAQKALQHWSETKDLLRSDIEYEFRRGGHGIVGRRDIDREIRSDLRYCRFNCCTVEWIVVQSIELLSHFNNSTEDIRQNTDLIASSSTIQPRHRPWNQLTIRTMNLSQELVGRGFIAARCSNHASRKPVSFSHCWPGELPQHSVCIGTVISSSSKSSNLTVRIRGF